MALKLMTVRCGWIVGLIVVEARIWSTETGDPFLNLIIVAYKVDFARKVIDILDQPADEQGSKRKIQKKYYATMQKNEDEKGKGKNRGEFPCVIYLKPPITRTITDDVHGCKGWKMCAADSISCRSTDFITATTDMLRSEWVIPAGS